MNYIKNIFLILVNVTLVLSCESFLDKPPLDAIDNESYWQTAKDLEKYILKYYLSFPSHGRGMALEDGDSDNLIQAVANPVMNGERGNTTGNWVSEWNTIRSINIFFDNYRNVTDDFEIYRHNLGEAHFFKAWFYFNLLTTYGDIPWYTNTLEPYSEELHKSRDPRTLVVDSILAHIDKSIEYLDDRSVVGNVRLNKETALAFKTRVALFEGTWQKYHDGTPFGTESAHPEKYFQACIEASEELINGNYTQGIYNNGNPNEDYYTLFGLENMSSINEVLLWRVAENSESLGNDVQLYTTAWTGEMGMTWSLISSYLSKSGTPVNYIDISNAHKGNDFLTNISKLCDPRLHATVWVPGDLRVSKTGEQFDKPFIDKGGYELCPTGFQVKKFSNPNSEAAGSIQTGGFSETGYILFRYAEVLLNYAEAKYELDGTISYDVLNLLRQRVGMPEFKVIPQSEYGSNLLNYGYEIEDALYAIRNERRVELALEGRRSDDYRRWAASNLFLEKRPLGYPFKASEFPNFNPTLTDNGLIDFMKDQLPNGYNFRENRDYLDDIPQDELTLNPKLEQNPGW